MSNKPLMISYKLNMPVQKRGKGEGRKGDFGRIYKETKVN